MEKYKQIYEECFMYYQLNKTFKNEPKDSSTDEEYENVK
jgi:hypothetical protein